MEETMLPSDMYTANGGRPMKHLSGF